MTRSPPDTCIGLMRTVAANIRARRIALEMPQAELASAVGLSRTSITNIEMGRQGLFVIDLGLFAEALRTTPAALVTGTTD